MIFITLGTQDKSFKRLLEEVDELIDKKIINTEVIVQCGQTKYISENMKLLDFVDSQTFLSLVESCDYLITHGGVGSIMTGLRANKKVIALARLTKFGEHVNDHQIEIIREFKKRNLILGCEDSGDLTKLILQLPTFNPDQFKANGKSFCKFIENIIENKEE